MNDVYNDLTEVETGAGREELVELERVQNSFFPSLGSGCLRVWSQGRRIRSVPGRPAKRRVSVCLRHAHWPCPWAGRCCVSFRAGQGACGFLVAGLLVASALVAGHPSHVLKTDPPASLGGPLSPKEGPLTGAHWPFPPSLLPWLRLPGLQGQLLSESVLCEAWCW